MHHPIDYQFLILSCPATHFPFIRSQTHLLAVFEFLFDEILPIGLFVVQARSTLRQCMEECTSMLRKSASSELCGEWFRAIAPTKKYSPVCEVETTVHASYLISNRRDD